MNIKIGEVIKRLRLEQSVTQENLAAHLGISTQAISKWENNMSYPDITLIPSIALFFDVTTDELFSFSTCIDTHKFVTYQKTYQKYQTEGAVQKQIALCRQMLLDYPRNFIILSDLASALTACYEGLEDLHKIALDNHYLEEAIKLSEMILSDCIEDDLKWRAIKTLCKYYPELGQTDKAMALVSRLPSIAFSREFLLEDVFSGEDCVKQEQLNLLQLTDLMAQLLIRLSFAKNKCIPGLSMAEKINFVNASNQMYQLVISDENYLFFHHRFAWNYRRLAELYLACGECDKSIQLLEKAFTHAKLYDNLPDAAKYTAPFISYCEYEKENFTKSWEGNECEMLYYRMTAQGTFDALKEHPDFEVLLEKVTSYIKK